ncbi:hypothetical protein AVEN_105257-1, partial [Araneus ventricosus]
SESRGASLSSKWRDEGVRLAKKLGTPSFRSSRGYEILGRNGVKFMDEFSDLCFVMGKQDLDPPRRSFVNRK